jgi:hypothetical protein
LSDGPALTLHTDCTTSETPIVRGLPPARFPDRSLAVIVIAPLYVPGAREPGDTDTFKLLD